MSHFHISFPRQRGGDYVVWVIRLHEKCVCPAKYPLCLTFLNRLPFSRSRFLENPLRLRKSIAIWLFQLFLPRELQVLLVFWFCFFNGMLKTVKFPMWRKHDICSFKVLSLSTNEFKRKSSSTQWLFPLGVCLFVFLENSVLRPAAFLWCICSLWY